MLARDRRLLLGATGASATGLGSDGFVEDELGVHRRLFGAAVELFFEEIPHAAAEIHLIRELHAEIAAEPRGAPADAHELVERQQLLLVSK